MGTLIADDLLRAKQERFLAALPTSRSITQACLKAGIPRPSVYDWREQDQDFRARFDQAKEQIADDLEAELLRRAFAGEGQMPDTLGIFLLKGYRPMFRDSYNVNIKQTTITANIDLTGYSREELAALLQHALPEAPPLLTEGDAR